MPLRLFSVLASFRLLAVVLACHLGICVAFQFFPRTRTGIHCPQAVVQKVVVTCCGKIEVRKPQPGEAGFTQCRCLENSAPSPSEAHPPILLLCAVPAVNELVCDSPAMSTRVARSPKRVAIPKRSVVPLLPPPITI